MGTLAMNYYVKALDNYPYNLPDAMEALDYALSYDPDFPDAHYLMGRLYMEYMNDFEQARSHFEHALYADVNHILTYYAFLNWTVLLKDVKTGNRLLKYAKKIPGVNQPALFHKEALLLEVEGEFEQAVKLLKKGKKMSICDNDFYFLERERKRIKRKITTKKTGGKKKKKKTK